MKQDLFIFGDGDGSGPELESIFLIDPTGLVRISDDEPSIAFQILPSDDLDKVNYQITERTPCCLVKRRK